MIRIQWLWSNGYGPMVVVVVVWKLAGQSFYIHFFSLPKYPTNLMAGFLTIHCHFQCNYATAAGVAS